MKAITHDDSKLPAFAAERADYFSRAASAFATLLKGMAVTIRWMFKPAITVQYPDEKLAVAPRFRGMLVLDPDTCTSCTLCEQACPSDCISITAHQDPRIKGQRILDTFILDHLRCNYCRMCEDACPTMPVKSIRHSHIYEFSSQQRAPVVTDMVRGKPYDKNDGFAQAGTGGRRMREMNISAEGN